MSTKKDSLIVVGPALSRSGYGEQTRFAISCLKKANKYDLFIHNTDWGNSNWIPHNDPQRPQIDRLISKTTKLNQNFRADISLQVGIPTDFKVYSETNIGYTAGSESTIIEEDWLLSCNMMNGIITPSSHSESSLKNSVYGNLTLDSATRVVNFPYTLEKNKIEDSGKMAHFLSETAAEFNFLSFAQISPRKNIFNLIKWFISEFKSSENVNLYLKIHRRDCSTIDRFETHKRVSDYIKQLAPSKKCGIYIIHGDLTGSELRTLYQSGKITHYLNASHGEGFGIPMFNAAASGLVTVSHLWSGERDYLTSAGICEVEYELKKVAESDAWPGVISTNSSWAYPIEASFREKLRSSIEDYDSHKKRAKIQSRKIKKKFTQQKQTFIFNQAVEEIIKNGEKKYVKQNSY